MPDPWTDGQSDEHGWPLNDDAYYDECPDCTCCYRRECVMDSCVGRGCPCTED